GLSLLIGGTSNAEGGLVRCTIPKDTTMISQRRPRMTVLGGSSRFGSAHGALPVVSILDILIAVFLGLVSNLLYDLGKAAWRKLKRLAAMKKRQKTLKNHEVRVADNNQRNSVKAMDSTRVVPCMCNPRTATTSMLMS